MTDLNARLQELYHESSGTSRPAAAHEANNDPQGLRAKHDRLRRDSAMKLLLLVDIAWWIMDYHSERRPSISEMPDYCLVTVAGPPSNLILRFDPAVKEWYIVGEHMLVADPTYKGMPLETLHGLELLKFFSVDEILRGAVRFSLERDHPLLVLN